MSCGNMIRGISVGVFALLLVSEQVSSQGQSPNPKPSNATALVGTSATFSCGPAQPGALITWSMQTYNRVFHNSTQVEIVIGEKELFYVNSTTLEPVYAANVSSDKYGVTNDYYLVVRNVDTTDAVPYFCSSPNASDVTNRAYANLVVIVDLMANFYATTSQSVALACDVSFMSPNPYVSFNPPQNVQLSLVLADETLRVEDKPSTILPFRLQNLTINYTISRQNLNNQTQFKCLVTSMSGGAPYEIQALGNIEEDTPGPNRASALLQSTATIGLAVLLAFSHRKIQKPYCDLSLD